MTDILNDDETDTMSDFGGDIYDMDDNISVSSMVTEVYNEKLVVDKNIIKGYTGRTFMIDRSDNEWKNFYAKIFSYIYVYIVPIYLICMMVKAKYIHPILLLILIMPWLCVMHQVFAICTDEFSILPITSIYSSSFSKVIFETICFAYSIICIGVIPQITILRLLFMMQSYVYLQGSLSIGLLFIIQLLAYLAVVEIQIYILMRCLTIERLM
jgi:hypothetical protein